LYSTQKITSENLIGLRTAGWCWVVLPNIDKLPN